MANMEILVSGLVDPVSSGDALRAAHPSRPLRWIEPELLEQTDGEVNALLARSELVWMYQAPARYAVTVGALNAQSFFQWVSVNRRALNLRRELGKRLTIMAAPTCSQSDVRDVLLNMLLSLVFPRSEEHTSELQSLMRISYAVFCLTNKKKINT